MSHPPIVLHGCPNGRPIVAVGIVVARDALPSDEGPAAAASFVRFHGDTVEGEGWFVLETVDEIANLLDARRLE